MVNKAIRNISKIHKEPYSSPHMVSVIIPAAGEGIRMKSYGVKALIQLKPHLTILDHQLKLIDKCLNNVVETVLVTGFQANKVMNIAPQNIIKVENERYTHTNVVRSIGIGLRAITTDHVLIIYGDLVFNKQTLKLPINENTSFMVIDNSNTMSDREIGCTIYKDRIKHLSYGLQDKWAQILFLTGRELKLMQQICWNYNKERMFAFEAINEIISKGGKFKAISPNKMAVTDVDCSKDIPIAQGII